MDNLKTYKLINNIETTLDDLKNDIVLLENEKCRIIENRISEQNRKLRCIENANLMRKAMKLFAKGLPTFAIAEKIAPDAWSVWDTYYLISQERVQNNARKRYARTYIVKALADNGFSLVEISKIAGYTPQRCGQILKNGVF